MTSASSLAGIIALLEQRYPPSSAEPWDAVGLVCGDPDAAVRRILWAVDPVEGVVDEALAAQVDLIVTHHPLFLSGVHSVAATTAKGRVVHRLISAGIGLYCAHTNADIADPGVSDALAHALGVTETSPVIPSEATARDNEVAEVRLEMPLTRGGRPDVVAALLAAHPHEEPAYEISERAALPGALGLGRIGELGEPVTLADFAQRVAESLPATHHGVRVAGAVDREVRRVAVCGGSGDSLLAAATALGADVLVTADLKHHRALEHLEDGGCAIIDIAHWASEWPWLAQASRLLQDDLAAEGTTVDSIVSTLPTDPWAMTLRGDF